MHETVLHWLKYLGFATTALSGVWSLISKTTYDDEQGHKRLTVAGHVAVAFILGAWVISALAFTAEGIVANDRNQAVSAAARDKERRTEELQYRQEQADQARDFQRRAEAAEQRTLSLALAVQQRERDLALARRVNESSQRNLQRAEQALHQLDRLAQPLQKPHISLSLMTGRLAEVAGVQALRDYAREASRPGFKQDARIAQIERNNDNSIYLLDIPWNSPLYPQLEQAPVLWMVVARTCIEIEFFTTPPTKRALSDTSDLLLRIDDLDRPGDAAIKVYQARTAGFRYYPATDSIELLLADVRDSFHLPTQGITSLPDLVEATMVLAPVVETKLDKPDRYELDAAYDDERSEANALRWRMHLGNVLVFLSGRTYDFAEAQTQRFQATDGQSYFIAPSLKKATAAQAAVGGRE